MSKHDAAIKPYLDRMAASGNSQLAANDKRALDATIARFTRDPMNLANYVAKAEQQLATLKSHAPTLDFSEYERKISEAKQQSGGSQEKDQSAAKFQSGSEFDTQYLETFESRDNAFLWGEACQYTSEDIARAERHFQGLKSKYQSFLGSALGQQGKDAPYPAKRGALGQTVAKVATDEKFLGEIKVVHDQDAERWKIVRGYFNLMQKADYWSAAAKVFPQATEIQGLAKRLEDYRQATGNLNQWLSQMEANRAQYLKTVTMEPAKFHDEAVEADFKATFLATGWGKDVVKVNLWGPNWTIKKHEVTGEILNRSRFANIVTRGENGVCVIHEYAIQQDYHNGAYGKSHSWRNFDQSHEILCENVR